jgi:hypothetical protein
MPRGQLDRFAPLQRRPGNGVNVSHAVHTRSDAAVHGLVCSSPSPHTVQSLHSAAPRVELNFSSGQDSQTESEVGVAGAFAK